MVETVLEEPAASYFNIGLLIWQNWRNEHLSGQLIYQTNVNYGPKLDYLVDLIMYCVQNTLTCKHGIYRIIPVFT
jgi:hypothetical protein